MFYWTAQDLMMILKWSLKWFKRLLAAVVFRLSSQQQFSSLLCCQPSALLLLCVCKIVLWLQPHRSFLFSLLLSDSKRPERMFLWQRCLETEGSCTVNVRKRDYFQIAQAPKKKKEKKNQTLFFISYLAYKKKKNQDWGEEFWGRRMRGNYWAQCKEVKLFSLGTCLKDWAEAWKVSPRKFSTN